MFKTMLLIGVLGQTSASWDGAVTSATGRVVIARDGVEYAASQGAGIRAGDRVTVPSGGALGLYLQGSAVYLGPHVKVRVLREEANWTLALDQGEIRITTREPGLWLRTKQGTVRIQTGILQARADAGRTLAHLDRGVAAIVVGDTTRPVAPGHVDYLLTRRQMLRQIEHDSARWTIDASRYQLAAATSLLLAQRSPAVVDPAGRTPNGSPRGSAADSSQTDVDDILSDILGDEDPEERIPPRDQEGATPEPLPDADSEPAPAARDAAQLADTTAESSSRINGLSFGFFSGLSLGSLSATGPSFASGGLFSDANQQTLQGMHTNGAPAGDPFPGNIHLITAESRYAFADLDLTAAESSQLNSTEYWSIGAGAIPSSQVTTDFLTGSNAQPTTVPIPRVGPSQHYLVRLDQYGVPDAGLDPAEGSASNIGLTGLVGESPVAPSINGAVPLEDNRGSSASFNNKATFALGEFRFGASTESETLDSPELAIRRSAQDRTIVKDSAGNDANDLVTTNPDVASFDDVVDPRFLPAAPLVKVPSRDAFDSAPTNFSRLDAVRRAGATTLVAEKLFNYARRTGQTRYVLDGQVIDISGYRR